MTRLYNDPVKFVDEAIEGFVAAHAQHVCQVPGGVIRNTRSEEGTVAVVIGGGSGHYPAFAGLVGQGLAHGAVIGNLFASPSAQQIYNVCKAANNGGGILLSFGNYAGDVLHFGQARERLIREGIPCEIVAVTDDISSASHDELQKRRGIAGDLTVFKTAAAAAEAGYSLEDVARVSNAANLRTRSMGVAFDGCTLPGAEDALFHVPDGKMAVGLGIHGEPGISEQEIPSADELAELLVSHLLKDVPDGITSTDGSRASVLLNGLGAIKYEELFVVYRRVNQLLEEAGIEIIEPEVGELVTSLDMAGTSLTLFWLDDELEHFWRAPVDSPAYRKGSLKPATPIDTSKLDIPDDDTIPPASEASTEAAHCINEALSAIRQLIDDNVDELGRLDAIAGDGDHGIGMQRGAVAASEAANKALSGNSGAGTLLHLAAEAWADRAGGTSGAIWGVMLNALSFTIGDRDKPTANHYARALIKAKEDVMNFGKAKAGDKTLVDVLIPFSHTLEQQVSGGDDLANAWGKASAAAAEAAEATADMIPQIGRARPLAEKSLGTPDPGAKSLAMIVGTVHEIIQRHQR
ncbi:dihydroxyacetone kinase family protein [Chromohalobacter sp. HP20-39]|uniref:dihydroxyacetone kinase family protein n=1 Tax=Chromohalobacter sp. HP20-39 TaxID=3079306 RepID=UPI00294AF491|nr:dihydroxyacetone kinase family protein [Chromohalobacter sp. HP20-39]MDV6318139.1 dihydroxyacetone kinase family protein [Chromohalobacter sp. HP20-39]